MLVGLLPVVSLGTDLIWLGIVQATPVTHLLL
jgi:hypothetical protein